MTGTKMLDRTRRRALALILLLVTAAVLTACGSDDTDADADDSSAVDLTIDVAPAVPFAPLFVGLDKGIFEKHGINLEVEKSGASATAFPRLLKGDLDLAGNVWGSLVTSAQQDLPLVSIAPVDQGGETLETDYQALVTGADGVTDVRDLEGKTVGVPGLLTLGDAQLRTALKAEGVDVSTIKFLPVRFPDVQSALESGQIDAGVVAEPFRTLITSAGGHAIAAITRGQLMGAIIASERMVDEKPEVVERFQTAWLEALEASQEDEAAVRQALVDHLGMPEEVAETANLPQWLTSVTADQVQQVADMMLEAGVVDDRIEADTIMVPFPLQD